MLCQSPGTQECDTYQGHLTCLFSHLWGKILVCFAQQEAGGEQREREGKPRKTNRPLREEGELEGLNGEREERGGGDTPTII